MADINNNDNWFGVETLAKLKILPEEQFGLCKVENIRGGRKYKIRLSTLEEELQLKYFLE